jgi:hypothetical protein
MQFRAFLAFVLLLSGCATHHTGVSSYELIETKGFENPPPTIDDNFESSTLIVKREIGAYASLLPAKIYIDGLFLTNIKEGQYIELEVEPGSHYLLLSTNGLGLLPFTHELPINVAAGKKYYYRIHPGWPDGMQITESPD